MEVGDLIEHTYGYVSVTHKQIRQTEVLIVEADEGQLVVLRPLKTDAIRIYGNNGSFKLPKEYLLKNAKIINGKSKI